MVPCEAKPNSDGASPGREGSLLRAYRGLRGASLSQELLIILAGRVVTAVAAIGYIRIGTGLLSASEFGVLSILTAAQLLCGLFLISPAGQYLNRRTHEWLRDGTLLCRLHDYSRYVSYCAAVGAVVIFAWAAWARLSLVESLVMAFEVLGVVFSVSRATTYTGVLNLLGWRLDAVIWSSTTSVLSLLLAAALTLHFHSGVAWFAGTGVGAAIGAWGAYRRIVCRSMAGAPGKGTTSLHEGSFFGRNILTSYIIPLSAVNGLVWMGSSGYRFIIERAWGLKELGILAVCFALASQLWAFFETLITQLFLPDFYARVSSADRSHAVDAFSSLVNLILPIYLLIASALVLAAPQIVKILIAPKYGSVGLLIVGAIVFEGLRTTTNLFALTAQVDLEIRTLIQPYVCGAIVLGCSFAVLIAYAARPELSVMCLILSVGTTLALIARRTFATGRLRLRLREFWFSALLATASSLVAVLRQRFQTSVGEDAVQIALVTAVAILWLGFLFGRGAPPLASRPGESRTRKRW